MTIVHLSYYPDYILSSELVRSESNSYFNRPIRWGTGEEAKILAHYPPDRFPVVMDCTGKYLRGKP